jgi:hypothetical protein
MAEITVMDILLLVLSALFVSIGFAMRRLRNRMEADMKKNVIPFMGMRHMFKRIETGHAKKKR